MTIELTTEQIVTNLLASNEVLKYNIEKNYTNENKSSLGHFLTKLSKEEVVENITNKNNNEISKYTFIKGKWIF